MAKKLIRKTVDRNQWRQYFNVAEENYLGAMTNYDFELWTSAGILFVHSAIAYTDSLTIKAGSVKSSGEDHMQVVELVKQVISISRADNIALNRLIKILIEKSKVAYGGKIYSKKQVDSIKKNLKRYRTWIVNKIEVIV